MLFRSPEKEGGDGADDGNELNMEFSDMKKKKKKKKGLKDLVEGEGEGAGHDDDEDKENEGEYEQLVVISLNYILCRLYKYH